MGHCDYKSLKSIVDLGREALDKRVWLAMISFGMLFTVLVLVQVYAHFFIHVQRNKDDKNSSKTCIKLAMKPKVVYFLNQRE